MNKISHRMIDVNGIRMHIAEMGQDKGLPVMLFLHGFPDFWYSWRHQIVALSSLGFHAVAPDLRGFGDTDSPSSVSSYTYHHLVGDLVALINHLGVGRVFLVAHDWGALVGWHLCMFRPDKVAAFFCLSVPLRPRDPSTKPVEALKLLHGESYYICRFQKPGDVEAYIQRVGTATFLMDITATAAGPPKEEKMLPLWLSEEDVVRYVSTFSEKGFAGGLSYYRAMDLNWELTAPWSGATVEVPVKFVAGDRDSVYTTTGMREYIHGPVFKDFVPLLEDVVVMEDVGHFIHQEKAQEISQQIHEFFKKYM